MIVLIFLIVSVHLKGESKLSPKICKVTVSLFPSPVTSIFCVMVLSTGCLYLSLHPVFITTRENSKTAMIESFLRIIEFFGFLAHTKPA